MRGRGWKKLDAQKERLGPIANRLFEKRIAELEQMLPADLARPVVPDPRPP